MVGLSQQIASELGRKIESGEWAPDRKLPSTRALAAQYAVSLNTVQNAFRVLEGRGLVVRHPRRGGFVAPARHDGAGGAPADAARTVVLVAPAEGRVVFEDQWSYLIIRAAEGEFARAGYALSLWSAYDTPDHHGGPDVLTRIEAMRDQIAGVILLPFADVSQVAADLDRRAVPWVSVNPLPDPGRTGNFVTADNFEGGRLVGRCFARAGFERVAYLGPAQPPTSSTMNKLQGLIHGCIEGGMPLRNIDLIVTDGTREPQARAALDAHVGRFGGMPRAVFTAGDLLALGVLRFCRERGLSVPGDVAIVGSTGIDVAEYAHPPLSVLAQPMVELGTEAARLLLRRLTHGVVPPGGRHLPTRLILRESFTLPPDVLGELAAPTVARPEVPRAASV